jgi:hypothetical protein
VIEAQGTRHTITFRVDQLRQEPVIDQHTVPVRSAQKGTRVTVLLARFSMLNPS